MIGQLSVGFKNWVAGSQSQLGQIMSRPQASRRLSTLKRVIKAAASLDGSPYVKWGKVPLHSGRNSLSWLSEWYEGWRVKGGGSLNPTKHNWGVLTKRRGRDADCIHCHWQQSLNVWVLYMSTHPLSQAFLMRYTNHTTMHDSHVGVHTSLIQDPWVGSTPNIKLEAGGEMKTQQQYPVRTDEEASFVKGDHKETCDRQRLALSSYVSFSPRPQWITWAPSENVFSIRKQPVEVCVYQERHAQDPFTIWGDDTSVVLWRTASLALQF